ncbi:MAG TPA: O-antigen ligase family protein [Solirubrobacteraceae bacterium]|nr:O-antigen ligase family protein [Solirubrobacteraceae bacterium]
MAVETLASGAQLELAEARRRHWIEVVGWAGVAALVPAVLIYLSFNAGGYFPSANGFVAILLAQALVLRTCLSPRPFEGFSRALAVPLVALALYAAWQLTSALWSHATARTLDSYDRTLLYLLALTFFGSLRYTRQRINWMVRALVAALVAVCLIGLVSRVLPHLWPTASSFYDERLNYPLTYWNAEGMLAAIALILVFHLSAEGSEHWSVRILAAVVLPGVAATLLLTFSRGALAVTAVGLLAYCLLTRLHTLPGALAAVVVPTAVAVRSAWDATLLATTKATGPAAVVQGRHVALVVGLCMLAAGVLRGATLLLDARMATLPVVREPPPRNVRKAIAAGLGATVLVLALALGGWGFAHRQYEKFVHANKGAHTTQTRDRLSDVTNNGRLSLWKAALDIYDTQKLHGTGAATYQLQYPRYRSESLYVADAHSLYLQSLAELGLVGFVLILLVVLGILVGLATRIRGPDRPLYAALLAVTLAWAIHQAFDWDWQMPAVTLGVFILAAVALARRNDARLGMRGLPGGRTFVALGWLVLAIAPLLVGISYARLHSSAQDLKRGDCVGAKREALSSLSLSAKRPQAYVIVGVCDLEQGFAQAAVPAMAQAASLEPQSWEDQFWLGVARAGAGLNPHTAIAQAIARDPREAGLRTAARRLGSANPRQWEAAATRLRIEALISGKFAITSL